MPKIEHFWAKTRRVYRYRLSCTGTGMQWEPVPVQVKGVSLQVVPATPFFAYFRVVKSRIRVPMFRDPKK